MKVFVKVYPNSKEEKITKLQDGGFEIRTKAQAKDGKANKAVIASLAEYFNISKSLVNIKAGHSSKTKIVEINV